MSLNAKYQDFDFEELGNEEERGYTIGIYPTLASFSTWFIRIGLIIGAILLVYFFVVGKVLSAFAFIVGIIVAYFFGFFVMFCLDKLMTMND